MASVSNWLTNSLRVAFFGGIMVVLGWLGETLHEAFKEQCIGAIVELVPDVAATTVYRAVSEPGCAG